MTGWMFMRLFAEMFLMAACVLSPEVKRNSEEGLSKEKRSFEEGMSKEEIEVAELAEKAVERALEHLNVTQEVLSRLSREEKLSSGSLGYLFSWMGRITLGDILGKTKKEVLKFLMKELLRRVIQAMLLIYPYQVRRVLEHWPDFFAELTQEILNDILETPIPTMAAEVGMTITSAIWEARNLLDLLAEYIVKIALPIFEKRLLELEPLLKNPYENTTPVKRMVNESLYALPGTRSEDPSRILADQLGLWPGAVVPICESQEFAEFLPLRNRFYQAMDVLTETTCIRYINATLLGLANCLRVKMVPKIAEGFHGLYFVGRCYLRPQREIFLRQRDNLLSILRKLLHAIAGLFYEHQRSDRNHFVNVNYDSIRHGYYREFDIVHSYPPDIEGFPEFSFESIFHFPSDYRSKNGTRTIKPHRPPINATTKNKTKLFYVDALRVNIVYRQIIVKVETIMGNVYYGPAHCFKNPREYPIFAE